MSDLLTHIQNLNNEKRAWVAEDPENRWAGMLVEDLEFWNKDGIHTAEQFDRYMKIECYINVYKDEHGIKPRWVDWDSVSNEELDNMLENV